MGFTATIEGRRVRFCKPAPTRAELSAREAIEAERAGMADRPLHWTEAMRRIFGEERTFDTFRRLRSEGAIVRGRRIVLGTVARPGGARVLESQVDAFVAEYELAAGMARQSSKEQVGKAANQRPRDAGLRLIGTFETVVGAHLDVTG
jgi:hypothetical protein